MVGDSAKGLCSICGQSFPVGELVQVEGSSACESCRFRQGKGGAGVLGRAGGSGERAEQIAAGNVDRKLERAVMNQCFVRLTKTGTLTRLLGNTKSTLGPVLDLSMGGMQCITDLPVFEDEDVRVELRLPGLVEALQLRGIVRRRVKVEDRYRVGVEFVGIDFTTRQILDNAARQARVEQARRNVQET